MDPPRTLDGGRPGRGERPAVTAAALLQGKNAPRKPPKPPVHYDLNVEVGADGSLRVIPPLTNPPAASNPPTN
ncbi:MAG: hypothetical protein BWX84_00364 [Verrucomicrobia bacterium ADurb.Bin118]|nr:MAG: hypothetical protein BWX84_00364 [Verrucomicrobia bacterium ADurb.Bin118]